MSKMFSMKHALYAGATLAVIGTGTLITTSVIRDQPTQIVHAYGSIINAQNAVKGTDGWYYKRGSKTGVKFARLVVTVKDSTGKTNANIFGENGTFFYQATNNERQFYADSYEGGLVASLPNGYEVKAISDKNFNVVNVPGKSMQLTGKLTKPDERLVITVGKIDLGADAGTPNPEGTSAVTWGDDGSETVTHGDGTVTITDKDGNTSTTYLHTQSLSEALVNCSFDNDGQYTAASYQKLQDALAKGYQAINNANHTQAQIDSALDGINDAMKALKKAPKTTPQGPWHADDRYVTITHNYSTYAGFNFKVNHKAGSLTGQTFHSTGKYYHENGSTYLSLYNHQGQWVGYINQNAVTVATKAGAWQKASGYVTFGSAKTNAYATTDGNQVKTSGKALAGHTYKVTGKYVGFDGTVKYSIYDNKGKWLGYVSNVNLTKNAQGTWQPYNGYFTTTKKGQTMWRNFAYQGGSSTTKYYQDTYQIKGVYYHANGSKYYSLYDNKGKWMGYINASLGSEAKTTGGAWIGNNQTVKITKKGYPLWSGFFTKQLHNTSNLMNQTYKATGKYHNFNGSWYLSLYSGKTWMGYVNATAVKAQ